MDEPGTSDSAEGQWGDVVECPICYTVYDKPLQLSCGHTLCAQCIGRLVDQARGIIAANGGIAAPDHPAFAAIQNGLNGAALRQFEEQHLLLQHHGIEAPDEQFIEIPAIDPRDQGHVRGMVALGRRNGIDIKCPECRKLTFVPSEGGLPVNYRVQEIVAKVSSLIKDRNFAKHCTQCNEALTQGIYFDCYQCGAAGSKICSTCAIRSHNGHQIQERKAMTMRDVIQMKEKITESSRIAREAHENIRPVLLNIGGVIEAQMNDRLSDVIRIFDLMTDTFDDKIKSTTTIDELQAEVQKAQDYADIFKTGVEIAKNQLLGKIEEAVSVFWDPFEPIRIDMVARRVAAGLPALGRDIQARQADGGADPVGNGQQRQIQAPVGNVRAVLNGPPNRQAAHHFAQVNRQRVRQRAQGPMPGQMVPVLPGAQQIWRHRAMGMGPPQHMQQQHGGPMHQFHMQLQFQQQQQQQMMPPQMPAQMPPQMPPQMPHQMQMNMQPQRMQNAGPQHQQQQQQNHRNMHPNMPPPPPQMHHPMPPQMPQMQHQMPPQMPPQMPQQMPQMAVPMPPQMPQQQPHPQPVMVQQRGNLQQPHHMPRPRDFPFPGQAPGHGGPPPNGFFRQVQFRPAQLQLPAVQPPQMPQAQRDPGQLAFQNQLQNRMQNQLAHMQQQQAPNEPQNALDNLMQHQNIGMVQQLIAGIDALGPNPRGNVQAERPQDIDWQQQEQEQANRIQDFPFVNDQRLVQENPDQGPLEDPLQPVVVEEPEPVAPLIHALHGANANLQRYRQAREQAQVNALRVQEIADEEEEMPPQLQPINDDDQVEAEDDELPVGVDHNVFNDMAQFAEFQDMRQEVNAIVIDEFDPDVAHGQDHLAPIVDENRVGPEDEVVEVNLNGRPLDEPEEQAEIEGQVILRHVYNPPADDNDVEEEGGPVVADIPVAVEEDGEPAPPHRAQRREDSAQVEAQNDNRRTTRSSTRNSGSNGHDPTAGNAAKRRRVDRRPATEPEPMEQDDAPVNAGRGQRPQKRRAAASGTSSSQGASTSAAPTTRRQARS